MPRSRGTKRKPWRRKELLSSPQRAGPIPRQATGCAATLRNCPCARMTSLTRNYL
ncbi:unnamed protein product [Amoebophrya sp. A120]|nr:unnamed protein product [Amoebophrya sp. A120]|eukprot:GSA120T00021894001.1